jgi:hypothetical protein
MSPGSSDPTWTGRREDAQLIASAPTALAELLAENERLREMVREACGIARTWAKNLRQAGCEVYGDLEISSLAREVDDE